ncbi:outer membrane protein H precursor [alpha proteobacterium U9-1i]|nr:outer membrane protein H precursor [alpha proteobacterium U9-1i]
MRFLKHFIAAIAMAAAFTSLAPEAHAQRNRGGGQAASVIVIDYQRIIESSNVGRDMTTKLNQIRQQIAAEIGPEAQAIQTEQQSIAQAVQGQSQEQVRRNTALNSRLEQFEARLNAFRTRQQGLSRDMDYTQQMTINSFNTQITPIVRQVMEARGAGIVLDASAVNLMQPAVNATDDVVQRLNQSIQTIEVTRQSAPAPQQPPAGGQ